MWVGMHRCICGRSGRLTGCPPLIQIRLRIIVPLCILLKGSIISRRRASIFLRPPQQLGVTALSGVLTRSSIPRTVMLPRPLQDRKVPALRSGHTRYITLLRSTGSPALEATSTPPGARPEQRVHNSLCASPRCPPPTGTRAPARTSTPPGARPERHSHMCLLTPRAVLLPKPLQHLQVPACSGARTTVPDAVCVILVHLHTWASVLPPTSTPPGARRKRRSHTGLSFHGQSCSRSHATPPSVRLKRRTYNSSWCTRRHPRPPPPTGTHAPAPMSTPPGARLQRPPSMSPRPSRSRALAPISAPLGARPREETCAAAAAGGRLEVLKWAREHGCDWDEVTCACAARGGHLEVLKWAREHGCPWEEDIENSGKDCCACAAAGGHLEVLKWLREQDSPWDAKTCSLAAGGGHLEVLKWAREHHCPWDHWTRQLAEEEGHLELLQWAVEHGAP